MAGAAARIMTPRQERAAKAVLVMDRARAPVLQLTPILAVAAVAAILQTAAALVAQAS